MSEAFRTNERALFADARAAKKTEAPNVESRTGAMNDVFESRDGELQQYAQAFHALPRQVGAVFIVDEGGRRRPGAVPLAGLELFDAAPTFARAVPDRFKALGEGEDLRITRPDLVGGGLVARGRLVHLAAYRHAIRAEVGRGPVH